MMAVKPPPVVRKKPEVPWSNAIHQGHVLSVLRRMPDAYAHSYGLPEAEARLKYEKAQIPLL